MPIPLTALYKRVRVSNLFRTQANNTRARYKNQEKFRVNLFREIKRRDYDYELYLTTYFSKWRVWIFCFWNNLSGLLRYLCATLNYWRIKWTSLRKSVSLWLLSFFINVFSFIIQQGFRLNFYWFINLSLIESKMEICLPTIIIKKKRKPVIQ